MKTEIFKIKKSLKKGVFHVNPNIGWGLTLSLAFILILLFFIFGFYLFTQTDKELTLLSTQIAETTPKGQIKIVTKEQIEKVLEYFSAREKKSTQILNSYSPVVDPSL